MSKEGSGSYERVHYSGSRSSVSTSTQSIAAHQGSAYYAGSQSQRTDVSVGESATDFNIVSFDFSDKVIRMMFIRKVYSILMVQLLFTAGVIAWFVFHKPTKEFVIDNYLAFFITVLVLFLVLLIILCIMYEFRRKSPWNYIMLGVFTVLDAFSMAVISAFYNVREVMIAAGITAVVCLTLTLFAFQTSIDFTVCGGVLLVCFVILIIFGIVAIFVRNMIFQLIYASIGALLFSVYLIYDTQMMMGGKHKYSISPEEYIFAALNLYIDITRIFIYILGITSRS